jgi:hypothetical protein
MPRKRKQYHRDTFLRELSKHYTLFERVDDWDTSAAGVTFNLKRSWQFSDKDISKNLKLYPGESRENFQARVMELLRQTRRCYCNECLDTDMEESDLPLSQLAIEMRLRATVAKANGIPLDGTDENEARIDDKLGATK